MSQLDLFAPAKRGRPDPDKRKLARVLRAAETGGRVNGMTKRELRRIMRPLPPLTIPKG